MKRRDFITLLGGAAAWPLTVRAQKPGKLFRIGYLNAAIPGVLPVEQRAIAAFIMGLAERGLVQDRDFVIEYRYGDNRPGRLAEVAAELVDLKVDVLVTEAARTLGVQIQAFNADTGHEIDAAFQSMGRGRPDALFVAMTPFFIARRIQLVQLAAFHRLPAAYGVRDFAGVGGLMSYGSDLTDAYHQVGVYTGRILKGAKPADLPVVQSTKLELIINHQTSRMLGLTVPDTLLARADEVIE